MVSSTKGTEQNKMTKLQLIKAITKVAEATDKTKEEVAAKLSEKDQWTWFLVNQAAK